MPQGLCDVGVGHAKCRRQKKALDKADPKQLFGGEGLFTLNRLERLRLAVFCSASILNKISPADESTLNRTPSNIKPPTRPVPNVICTIK